MNIIARHFTFINEFLIILTIETRQSRGINAISTSFFIRLCRNTDALEQTDFVQKSPVDEREAYKRTPSEDTAIE